MSMISDDESASSDSAFMSSDSRQSSPDTTDPTTLDTLDVSPPPSKRRKISPGGDTTVSSAFTIRPPSTSPAAKELALTPIVLLSRFQLPLSWLDPLSGSTDGLPGLLFSANIPSLEEDLGHHDDPPILVSRSVDGGDLYAIERVKEGIYALCGLGDWISDSDVLVASKRWLEPRTIARRVRESDTFEERDGLDWRQAAEISDHDLDMGATEMQTDVDICMVFGPDQSFPGGTGNNTESINPSNAAADTEVALPTLPGEGAETGTPSVAEVLERLRAQYLEALYVAKTSVGYFAKGPLSRSRAALQQSTDKENPEQVPDVASIYRDGILPVKKMDVKYRETLPNIIKSLPIVLPEHEPAALSKPSKKRKSKKKSKLGRNGLYPEEESFIGVWWRNRHATETSFPMASSKETDIKQYVADLRLREMQLQILWILETISIEASMQEKNPKNAGAVESSSTKNQKTKKPQDLNVLLELLLDRLCIWHTVSFEESLLAGGAKSQDKNSSSGAKVESDKLRDFCTEVIIPFYASRLPDQCKTINRKLGGPSAISPVRQKRPQSKRTPQVQPGAAVQRTKPPNPRRTLQRVLTDEKAAGKKAPSLMRSNTAPTVPELKREASEPSLRTSFRGGLQYSKRLENREVDLDSTTKHHEAKLKRMNKLMEQKKELDTAITRLRKPNRELVAKEFAESADQRSRSRKPKNPVRNPLGEGVQVMATPRKPRKKNATSGFPTQTQSQSQLSRGQYSSPAHSTDVQVVPASNVRPGYRSLNLHGEGSKPGFSLGAQSQPAEINCVDVTPTRRKFSKSSSSLAVMTHEDDSFLEPSPSRPSGSLFKVPRIPARSTSDTFQSTPTASRRKTLQPRLHPDGDPVSIQGTPPKPTATSSGSGVGARVPASPLGKTSYTNPIVQITPVKPSITSPEPEIQLVPDSVPRPRRSSIETPQRQRIDSGSMDNTSPSAVRGRQPPTSPSPDKLNGDLYRSLGWDDDGEDELCMI